MSGLRTFVLDGEQGFEGRGWAARGWREHGAWQGGTAFGVVTRGPTTLLHDGDAWALRPATWFVMPRGGALRGGEGLLVIVSGYAGVRQVGGPLEARGRLVYVDGCTDTLLACPPRLGEPSLNHLHVPVEARQRAHTHASDRVGVIVRGSGWCITPDGRAELAEGMGWWIPANTVHHFVADADAPLDVVAWHPDSVFGPTDEHHPMRTGTLPVPPR